MGVNSDELMKSYTTSTALYYYVAIAKLLEERPIANSIFILVLLLPASVVFRQFKFGRRPEDHPSCERPNNSRPKGLPKEKYPLWVSLLLVFSPAFEFPFMFALHPVILASHSQPASPSTSSLIPNTLPSPVQLALQVAGYFVVQTLFTHYVLRFVTIPLATEQPETEKSDDDDELLTAMVMDFLLRDKTTGGEKKCQSRLPRSVCRFCRIIFRERSSLVFYMFFMTRSENETKIPAMHRLDWTKRWLSHVHWRNIIHQLDRKTVHNKSSKHEGCFACHYPPRTFVCSAREWYEASASL
ncbi:hypothetical protein UA08_01151 [Talaromyces atroroseus]|uniref:Uncharacterized protein n=1 Tax=Talaromyces atroroseus TaxID=1441469 RepID=A0A1Q5QAB4_TALAT|nr:hypothetical protein UA08_01151 [Talaromyces atroroseus]OKL62699.1 hypothetical protein UA08_01151 [Talaromyces atroroseus]